MTSQVALSGLLRRPPPAACRSPLAGDALAIRHGLLHRTSYLELVGDAGAVVFRLLPVDELEPALAAPLLAHDAAFEQ
jgi:hypothetical protein